MKALAGLLAVSGMMFGQAFELADIHLSAKVTDPYMRGGAIRNGRYEVKDATLLDLIATAYNVPRDRVQGGPTWLDSDRYDIIAKADANATPDQLKRMLGPLLADRFKLQFHRETRELPVYALTVLKGGPKFKEGDGGPFRVQPD